MRRVSGKAIAWSASAVLAASVIGAAGCSNDKPTELVPGALSQVQVPRDLSGIEVEVKANGVVKFCTAATVYDGQVELPRTLGVISGESAATIITVTLRGYSQAAINAGNSTFGNCDDTTPVGSANGAQVLRRSIQTFVGQHTLFLPMPLSYSCFNTDCSGTGAAGSTNASCAASRCVDLSGQDPAAVAAKLVDFTPDLLDGKDVCFDPTRCFSDEQPAVPVVTGARGSDASAAPTDATTSTSDCTFTFQLPPSGQGLNVRIFYQDYTWKPNAAGLYEDDLANAGEVEILNEDPDEGFTLSADGRQFTLAPGLCDLFKAASAPPPPPTTGTRSYHTISALRVASACEPKKPLLPICAGQQNLPSVLPDGGFTPNLPDGGTTVDGTCNVAVPLVPAPSALYMVMDDSQVMHAAFGVSGQATALNLSLTDPIFKRTSAAFKFLPHKDMDCAGTTTSFTTPDLPFKLAADAQPAIADRLQNWMAPDTAADPANLDLHAAMRPGFGAYAEVSSFLQGLGEVPDVAAAMFFINRVPDPTPVTGNDCPISNFSPLTPTQAALQELEGDAKQAFASMPNLRTFFVVLDDDAHDGVAVPFYTQMQTDLPQAVTTIDATSQTPAVVLGNFTSVVTQLGTCLYEVPAGVSSPAQLQVSYSVPAPPGIPIVPPPVPVALDTGCSASTQDTANGWNIDSNGRLRICGQPCADLRTAILGASAAAVLGNVAVPDIPVNATVLCNVPGDAGLPPPIEDASTLFPPEAAPAEASTDAAAEASQDATVPAEAAAADAAFSIDSAASLDSASTDGATDSATSTDGTRE